MWPVLGQSENRINNFYPITSKVPLLLYILFYPRMPRSNFTYLTFAWIKYFLSFVSSSEKLKIKDVSSFFYHQLIMFRGRPVRSIHVCIQLLHRSHAIYCITCFFLIIVKSSYKPIVNAYSIQKTLTPIIDEFKEFPVVFIQSQFLVM